MRFGNWPMRWADSFRGLLLYSLNSPAPNPFSGDGALVPGPYLSFTTDTATLRHNGLVIPWPDYDESVYFLLSSFVSRASDFAL